MAKRNLLKYVGYIRAHYLCLINNEKVVGRKIATNFFFFIPFRLMHIVNNIFSDIEKKYLGNVLNL